MRSWGRSREWPMFVPGTNSCAHKYTRLCFQLHTLLYVIALVSQWEENPWGEASFYSLAKDSRNALSMNLLKRSLQKASASAWIVLEIWQGSGTAFDMTQTASLISVCKKWVASQLKEGWRKSLLPTPPHPLKQTCYPLCTDKILV